MLIHRCRFVDFTPASITALEFNQESAAGSVSTDLRLAVGRSNGDIEIWNPRWSWIHETTLKGGKDRSIEGLAWTRYDGGYRLFSIGGSTSITEWDLATGMPLANHECHSGVIWSIAVSPDGTKIAAGCDNGAVSVLEVSGGPGVAEHYKVMQRQSSRIMSLAWKNDDQIVGGCSDGKIRSWSISAGGRNVATMKVDKSRTEETFVWSILVLQGGKQIVSGDSTGSVKFWDGDNFTLSRSFKTHEADVLCLTSDSNGQTVFSAGVDRQIVCYKSVNKKWINISNRLLHSHDIRALALFESEKQGFLVSGGVETTLVINSVKNFADGMFRKIPVTKQKPCVAVLPSARYVMLWNDHSVKIWMIGSQSVESQSIDSSSDGQSKTGKHLISKISMSNEENVTHVAINEAGTILAVSTLSEIKIFELKLKTSAATDAPILSVSKRDISGLASQGATLISFLPGKSLKLAIVSPDNEVLVYDVEKDAIVHEIEVPEAENFSSSLPHMQNVSGIAINEKGILAASRHCGAIDLFDLKKGHHLKTLANLSHPPTALDFGPSDETLVVVTAEIKVLEFETFDGGLSLWSRKNSDLIPRELAGLADKCCGIFKEYNEPYRVWMWGANWLAFIDLGVNIPIQKIAKRRFDQLAVDDEINGKGKSNGTQNGKTTNGNGHSSVSRFNSVSSSQSSPGSPSANRQPFWITHKYRPMILASVIGPDEIVVSERPTHTLPLPPAFWSNHKIQL